MTTTHDERQKLAAMGNALRPDWPTGSLYTHLTREHQARSYRDLAIALAWIATDPATKTPARLTEPGPWWSAAKPAATTASTPTGRMPCCNGFHAPKSPCHPRDLPAHHRRTGPAQARAYLAELGVIKPKPAEEDTPDGES